MLTRVEVRDAVERAERRFVDACEGTTTEHWEFQPEGTGSRAWTIPQVVEHVTGANAGILRVLQDVVVSSPRGDRHPDFEDADLPYIFYGGGGPAPAGAEDPVGTRMSRDESVAGFQASMRSIVDWYDGVEIDLRDCALRHPAFGLFDGAQWLLFVAVHAQQHRGQILDVQRACDSAGATTSGR